MKDSFACTFENYCNCAIKNFKKINSHLTSEQKYPKNKHEKMLRKYKQEHRSFTFNGRTPNYDFSQVFLFLNIQYASIIITDFRILIDQLNL